MNIVKSNGKFCEPIANWLLDRGWWEGGDEWEKHFADCTVCLYALSDAKKEFTIGVTLSSSFAIVKKGVRFPSFPDLSDASAEIAALKSEIERVKAIKEASEWQPKNTTNLSKNTSASTKSRKLKTIKTS